MQKIPTVFKRDPEDPRRLLPEVHPHCQWVLDGEGVGTRKFDGTCCMFDGEKWWARREVKRGKMAPNHWVEVDHDEVTGKRVGWEPIEQSGFYKWFLETNWKYPHLRGTYELCGPKINDNPEGFDRHTLIPHSQAEIVLRNVGEFTFDSLKVILLAYGQDGKEGIVWHHPDGRMAKLKTRDFKFD